MPEIEGKGLDYERYALDKLFARLVREHGFERVLEVPAKGEKAMPSIYSLSFGRLERDVTLVNAEPKSKWAWEKMGYPVSYEECGDLTDTRLPAESWDVVWNFMSLAQQPKPDAMLAEMMRLSKRYVLFVAVNRFNPGFLSHRTVHKINKVPWNHGDVKYMSTFWTSRHFREQGLRIVERGVVDCPPYPDSLGFRDMRLHRKNVDLNKIDWDSRTFEWMKTGVYPPKMKFMYMVERLPLPWVVKLLYAHLHWVLAEKTPGGAA